MTAIEEAQQHKCEIQDHLADELKAFSERTGLLISDISIEAIETTTVDDKYRKFGHYSVEVEIRV